MNMAGWRPPRVGHRVGDYEVTGELAPGGHGSVLEATRGGRRYAIKFLSREQRRSREEVQVLMRAQVEGVVRLHAYGCWPEEESGCHYVVMDYVPGETADVYVHHHNLAARQVMELVLHVATALAEVHRLGVLHRDLKPENIMVHEETGRPVLVDFGSGWITRFTPKDRAGLPRCTPPYVSPEAWRWAAEHQGDSESYPYRVTDEVWALGVSCYELLTGRLPFGDGWATSLVPAVWNDTPLAPHVRNPRVPRALGDWVLHLLAKDPAARPQDMSALCAALRSVLEKAAGDPAWEVPLRSTATPELLTSEGAPLRGSEAPGERDWLQALKPGQARARPAVQELPGRTEQDQPASSPGASPGPTAPRPPVATAQRWNVHQRALWGLCGALALALVVAALVWGLQPRSTAKPEGARSGVSPGRARGTCWRPPVQACLVREVAHPWEPAEADEGAEFQWVSSPALHPTVKAPQQDAMPQQDKKQKPLTRALRKLPAGMCCLTAACTVLVACPATPERRPMPQGEECPPGAAEGMKGLYLTGCTVAIGSRFGGNEPTVIALGPIQGEFVGACGGLPEATQLSGYLVAGRDRAYPRFTQATTPDGNTFPVCLQANYNGVDGMKIVGDAPPGYVKIWRGFKVQERERF